MHFRRADKARSYENEQVKSYKNGGRNRKRFIRMSLWFCYVVSKRLESLISDSARITPINYGGKDKNTFLFTFSVTSAHNKVFSGPASWVNWSVWSWWDQIAVVGFELCFINANFYFEQFLMQSSSEIWWMAGSFYFMLFLFIFYFLWNTTHKMSLHFRYHWCRCLEKLHLSLWQS